MTSQYRHRRTSTPATPFPTLEPGEIAVNTANRQISVGDAATPTLGTPKPLLAIRFFDIAAIYAIGDIVTNADKIWRAIVANGPGAFNAAQWELAASQVTIAADPPSNAVAGSMWWDSDNGMLYVRYNDGDSSQWVQATAMPVVDTTAFVLKAGDTMTGDLTINKATPLLVLNDVLGGVAADVRFNRNSKRRWLWRLSNDAETGSNAGSSLSLIGYADDGTTAITPVAMQINRATGEIYVAKDPTQAVGVATKQYVDARAGDAMAYSGMQINGNFEISQEFGTTGGTGSGRSFCDGWRCAYGGTMVMTSGIGASGLPDKPVIGYIYASTAQASLGTGDYAAITTTIEGYRAARLAWGTASARPITIGFWSQHTRVGTYCLSIRNPDASRSYVATYTQNVINVPEWKTITIPGCTDGVWGYTNGAAMTLFFMAAAGTAYNAPAANTWNTTAYLSVAGQVNNVQAVNDTLRLMGVVILPGTQAPTAAQSPLLMRPYEQELLTCQRYYQKSYSAGVNVGADASAGGLEARYIASPAPHGQVYASVSLPIKMRATPTVTIYGYHGGATKISDGAGNDLAANSGLISNPGDARFHVGNNSGISLTLPGNFIQFHWTADARL
jgi:hypothetical protein